MVDEKVYNKINLLEEARKRYSIGTTYWNLNLIGERSNQFKGATPHQILKETNPYIVYENYKGFPVISRGDGNGFVYSGGIWAEIVNNEILIEIW